MPRRALVAKISARLDEMPRLTETTTRDCMSSEMGEEVEADVSDADLVDEDDLAELSDEAVLEEGPGDDLDDDDVVDDDVVDDVLDEDVIVELPEGELPVIVPLPAEPDEAGAEDDDDDEEDDDVEASLDVILKERLVVADDEDEDEDEEEAPDAEDRADGTLRVLPKQPGEFVCQSCFLVKSETQLADGGRMLCRDCV
jgi:hypothetical protein